MLHRQGRSRGCERGWTGDVKDGGDVAGQRPERWRGDQIVPSYRPNQCDPGRIILITAPNRPRYRAAVARTWSGIARGDEIRTIE